MNTAATSIECSVQPLDLSFHPTAAHIVAAALVDGTVEVHDFEELLLHEGGQKQSEEDDDDEVDTIVSSTAVHTQLLPSKGRAAVGNSNNNNSSIAASTKQANCRAVLFAQHHQHLYSAGTAGDLVALDPERLCTFSTTNTKKSVLWSVPNASQAPLHVLHEITGTSSPTAGLLVTGDDAGGIRVWDPRIVSSGSSSLSAPSHARNTNNKNKPTGCVYSWKEHDDYISDLDHSADGFHLVAASADCTLSVYDLRMDVTATTTTTTAKQPPQQPGAGDKSRVIRRSDHQDDELLSCQILKNGKKVVCGTAEGVLSVWSWGAWGDISDRFPGHPSSLDALLKLDEDTLLTGSSDGLIRVVSIHPDKFLGVIGDHSGFPIEKLRFNANRQFVGSVTHDNIIRLWDASLLHDDDNEANDGANDSDENDNKDTKMPPSKTSSTTTIPPGVAKLMQRNTARDSDDEWEDMDEDMSNNDKDNDSDDTDSGSDDDEEEGGINDKRKARLKTENEKFFEDL